MNLRHDQPRSGRQPTETRVSTVKVEAWRSGPEVSPEAHNPYRLHTLGDVAAWVERLRELGASDDLPLKEAEGLTVTLDAKP